MSEIRRLSYSMVKAYLDCGHFFYYRYVRKFPAVLEGKLIAGRVYHHGVAYGLKRRKAGECASVEEVHDVMSDRWESETREKVYYEHVEEPQIEARRINWGEDNPGKLKDTVLKLGALYIKTMVPKLQPIAVEERIEGIIGGVPFVGYPDLIVGQSLDTAGVGIIDHKLVTKQGRNYQEFINKDMQFSAYAALIRKPIWAAWHQAPAWQVKKPSIKVITTERNRGDIDFFACIVSAAWKGINSGVFIANPLSWRCGERCSYYLECRVLMEALL
jgi:hypothetical protein